MMEITLVRHTSVDVPKGTCYGWSDVPVRDTFEEEAEETKRQLQEIIHYQHHDFDAVFSSPLTRARKLATYCGYPNYQTDDRLKEMNMGEWEMRRYEDIEREDPRILDWYQDYLHVRTTGGEVFTEFYERVKGFFDELRNSSAERVAIFAHGGVLVCASIYMGRFKMEEAFNDLVPYGGIRRYYLLKKDELKQQK